MELRGGGNGQRHQTAQRDQVEWDGKVPYSLINTKKLKSGKECLEAYYPDPFFLTETDLYSVPDCDCLLLCGKN